MMPIAAPDPVAAAVDLLDRVADANVDKAIADLEGLLHRLRASATEAAVAREELLCTPAALLRDAILRRASRRLVRE